MIGWLVDRAVPDVALRWGPMRQLDGYLPKLPAGLAWYMRPVDRPATERERLEHVSVRGGRMHGYVQCMVTIGWVPVLGEFPPPAP